MFSSPVPVKTVSLRSISTMFNKSQYPEQIRGKKLVPYYLRHRHLEHPEERGEPWCTHAQMIRYCDRKGRWKVELFQYLRPDGSIGASGKPDPKRIFLDGTIYKIAKR